ncbi:hypothetical protein Bca52824_035376 [Brassica carinata]|uniref:Uncharacterized protein n=1 Tax=Brassica carinata TaxID=52824 RepID=A0A8X7V1N1_BRACI|nr:hypothetical protein Bca52824_035376 [Brassica carinata]
MSTRFVSFPDSIAGFSPELSVNTWNLRFLGEAQFSSAYGFRRVPRTRGRTLTFSGSSLINLDWDSFLIWCLYKVVERLKQAREGKQFMAMYSSVVGGITTDPAAMVLPLDDHIRGHGFFDTAMIINGSVIQKNLKPLSVLLFNHLKYLYELDQHLDRILRSASMAKIALPFDRETIRKILIQTVSVSGCIYGSLRPPEFATVKSVVLLEVDATSFRNAAALMSFAFLAA